MNVFNIPIDLREQRQTTKAVTESESQEKWSQFIHMKNGIDAC